MKKGCIIALVIFAALIAIGVAVFYFVIYPKTMAFANSGVIMLVESAAERCGEPAKIVKRLRQAES